MNPKFKLVNNLVDRNTCKMLADELQKLVNQNHAVEDTQVVGSYRVRDYGLFDELLEKCLPPIEKYTNKKLFPTYAFARLYKKGHVLEPHVDREACEYSATITLDYSGESPDPMFVSEIDGVTNKQEIKIDIGDALIYKGMQLNHWREPLKNEYQAQIFLHYVDADGDYADWKYDKRKKLSNHHNVEDDVTEYWFVKNAISHDSCDAMINRFEQLQTEKGVVGEWNGGAEVLAIRDVNKIALPCDLGIGATLAGMALSINNQAWKFDITNQNQTEYLKYEKDGHYVMHMDTSFSLRSSQTRKLTVLAFLNDDFEGGKLYLCTGSTRYYPPQEKGTVLVFPSFILHGVEPVTSGIRRSIVTWMSGPWFK